jgi:uncharacterized damage-inducible protein DinB
MAMSSQLFLERSRYFLAVEYPSKLSQCLEVLPESAVWARSNESSNSIGNLLLHLTGNVRQWIVGGVAQKAVERNRSAEFEARDGAAAGELMAGLEEALREAAAVLDGLSEEDLAGKRVVQGRETTVLGAVYHVVEHFAMHTGQIVLLAKIHAPGAIHFYEDAGALAKPLWKRSDVTAPR